MKWAEACRAAIQNLTLKRAVLPVMGIAAAVMCGYFTVAITNSVQTEKDLPCELSIALANVEKLTDTIAQQLVHIPNVKAVTPVLDIPVDISTGIYNAKMTLTAVDPSYGNITFKKGKIFQASSTMPYLVLNEAACKLFSSKTLSDKTSVETAQFVQPSIDWLNSTFIIQSGKNSRKITAKVCGITQEKQTAGKEPPSALISLSAGKELLRQNKQIVKYSSIKVRVLNSGCASGVTAEAAKLGVTATITDTASTTLQTKWDGEEKEKNYLIAIGLICLLFSVSFVLALHKIAFLEQADYFPFLKQPCIQKCNFVRIFRMQVVAFFLLGSLIGLVVAVVLPYFLPQGVQGTSVLVSSR